MAWQLQEAKQRLSEVLRRAEDEGPQVVTRHGREVAVVVSIDDYRRATGATRDFRDFLAAAPDVDLPIERSAAVARTVTFDDA